MDSKWTPYKLQLESMWSLYGVSGVQVESKWSLCGVYVELIWSIWSPCGVVGECKIQQAALSDSLLLVVTIMRYVNTNSRG